MVNKWYVIVNPVTRDGHGMEDFPIISELLREYNIPHETHFTSHKSHAVQLTVTAVNEGFRRILVIGGDGTLHEVVNGLFIQSAVEPRDVLLAMIPIRESLHGWSRTFIKREDLGHKPENGYRKIVESIVEECSLLQDVGVVSYEESHYQQVRYMVNLSCVGFTSMLHERLLHLRNKGRRSRLLYFLNMIGSFFSYKSTGVKIWVDDKLVYNDLMMSAFIGVGRYSIGGVQPLPDAVIDDGKLDVSLVKPIHFWHILFRIKYLFNGGIYRIGHIKKLCGAKVRIESSPEIKLDVDGDVMGVSPLEFTTLQQAIRIVVPRSFIESRK